MKRAERHHLKENELGHLAATAGQAVQARGGQVIGVIVAVIVVIAGIAGYTVWKNSVERRAHALLADALVLEDARVGAPQAPGTGAGPSFPTAREKYQAMQQKLKAVADQYPSSDAGLFARYREASMWVALGNTANAMTGYQQVVDRAGNTFYGDMARLGLAEAQAQAGQFEPAINTLKEMAQHKDGPLPVDGVLMRLARIYTDAGKPVDAEQTYNKLVAEYPESLYAADARKELADLKKS
jgi:predicted negative regulator of RcsB-dependent stress response